MKRFPQSTVRNKLEDLMCYLRDGNSEGRMHTFPLTFTKLEGHTRNCVNDSLGQRADKHINKTRYVSNKSF